MKAVVLAAGLGTRLRPLTYFLPKPLVAVGGRPLITHIIEWLRANGVGEIAVVGYYMQEVLESYLSERHPDVAFFKSRRLLGTAGQLYYVREWAGGDMAVVNTDVLTNLDLRHPLELHRSSGALLTIVGQRYRASLRFGVLDTEGSALRAWREKPTIDYITSTGIYIISADVVKKLGEEYLDMNVLATSLMPRVAVYTAKEAYFYDVGTLEDLQSVANVVVGDLKP
ncbi:MAG: nucleotidyltransferase family protein [Pyrobaculum sp.]